MITFNSNQYNINFGALVPKKDYAGPILKLTKKEQEQIDTFQRKISEFELEHEKIENLRQKEKRLSSAFFYYCEVLDDIMYNIKTCKNEIAKIKTERLAKQKEKLAKKNNPPRN